MRSTRQGCARGQGHGTLDREDLDLGSPGPWTWSARAQERPHPGAAQALHVIAAGGCWCGEDFNHPWPGKDSGAPHPRSN